MEKVRSDDILTVTVLQSSFHLDEMQHELPADRFVPMHVGHVLHVWFANHMFVRAGRHHHYPQIATCKSTVSDERPTRVSILSSHPIGY